MHSDRVSEDSSRSVRCHRAFMQAVYSETTKRRRFHRCADTEDPGVNDSPVPTDMRAAKARLHEAVGVPDGRPGAGLLERLFAHVFTDLVYAQIWEDPAVDLEALRLEPGHRMVAIASGGCNVLSYAATAPVRITAVDLNPAHVALVRLKLVAARHLPSHAAFHDFFATADCDANVARYDRHLSTHLDPASRAYWERRRFGRRRIEMFAGNVYRHGALGRFIGFAHWIARLHGVDPGILLQARSRAEQRRIFDSEIAPVFDRPVLRWLAGRTVSLYGLGIPPAQYAALAGGRPMADVLRERLDRLACDFDLADNYFARQAFGRGYGEGRVPLPPYLDARAFPALRDAQGRVEVLNRSITDWLAAEPDASLDRYVLLDAQDWMSDAQLTALWTEITRTARPGARVVFRTAAEPTLLPGRVPHAILSRWTYEAEASADLHARDRSAIYGGFHLYRLAETRP
jgi:S-adenosylmethionine-diacylglycerol 3-amino-3-carboxypropyl transferase